jgi:hypothetical protein
MPQKKRSKPSPAYRLQNCANKGKVVVAGRNIKQGNVIFEEDPILYTEDISDEDILSQFNELELNDQKKVLSLATIPDEDPSKKVLSLFKRRNINNSKCRGGQALYFVLSRVKHSCGPNIMLSPVSGKGFGKIEIRACQDIKKGEELRADYLPGINLFEPKGDRTKVFGGKFVCDCPVCLLPESADSESNEATRAKIKEHYRNTSIYMTLGDFLQAFEHCKAMLTEMESLKDEVFQKRVSVSLECWQLAVLANLQRPEVEIEVESFREKARQLCSVLGKSMLNKWEKTEEDIEKKTYSEFETVKMRSSGPWAVQIIQNLSTQDED